MTARAFRVLSPQAAERLFAFAASKRECSPDLAAELDALPALQAAALIGLTESHVKRALVARLLDGMPQLYPQWIEYRALADRGWAQFKAGKRTHELTDAGRDAAAQLEKRLCQRLQIHLLIESGADNYRVRFRCPCGWSASVAKGSYVGANAQRFFAAHVEAGQ